MNSTMGRVPDKAAPTPIPAKPASVIGVSITRFSPCFSNKPLVTYPSKEARTEWATENEKDAPHGRKKHHTAYLISTLVLSNFFTKKKHALVARHLFVESHVQGFTYCDLFRLPVIPLPADGFISSMFTYGLRSRLICIQTASQGPGGGFRLCSFPGQHGPHICREGDKEYVFRAIPYGKHSLPEPQGYGKRTRHDGSAWCLPDRKYSPKLLGSPDRDFSLEDSTI